MNVELKGLSTIDEDLRGVLHHDALYGTTNASYHEIYHYGNGEEQGNIFVPLFGKEAEPFGWNYDGKELLAETPKWFESRARIGRALWDAAVMNSMSYYVSREVLKDASSLDDVFKDARNLKSYIVHQMELIAYYEQLRYAKDDVKAIFKKHNEAVPYLIHWKDGEKGLDFYGVYSLNPNEYESKSLSETVSKEIENEFLKSNRDFIKREDQLPVGIVMDAKA